MTRAVGSDAEHLIPGSDAEFLRQAGERWTRQAAPKVDSQWRIQPDIELYEEEEDTGGGAGVVRLTRTKRSNLEALQSGQLRATRRSQRPEEGAGKLGAVVRNLFLGAPLASSRMAHERLSKLKALAILSSDALSSVAYATEQTLFVLVLASAGAVTSFALPIGGAIIFLLVIVGLSYRQTIRAYPNGGGSYIVAKDNLGPIPGLTAAAALMTDYVLTVAVSISAGIQAITSAFPSLTPFIVPMGLAVIGLMVLVNLRGVREAGTVFAIPTYAFIAGMALLLAFGFAHFFLQGPRTPFEHQTNYPSLLGSEALSGFLILRAFSSGCTALTGVEAISNGVPIFKVPEWRNARTTLMVMVGILGLSFGGLTILAHLFGLYPDSQCGPGLPGLLGKPDCVHLLPPPQTLISKLAHVAFANSGLYYYVQATTALILILAANTSFADFPRLLYLMARDKYAPSQFVNLGERLAFSNGIIALGVLAAALYTYFNGSTDALIPLYTIGVFLAFTLSQAGMVEHWRRLTRVEGGRASHLGSMLMNGTGAVMTTVVLGIAAYTKFLSGAWVVVVLVPVLVLLSLAIHRHYSSAKQRAEAETPLTPAEVRPVAIVPIADLGDVQLQTLALARRLADDVVAVFISDDPAKIQAIRAKWDAWGSHVPLQVIESPYRSLVKPFLDYLDAVDAQLHGRTLMVVLPELVFSRWWHQFLHNQTALRLKTALLFRPGTVVVNVPYHLREAEDRDPVAPH